MIKNRLTNSQYSLFSSSGFGGWSGTDITLADGGISEIDSFKNARQIQLIFDTSTGILESENINLDYFDNSMPMVFIFAIKLRYGGTITTTITEISTNTTILSETREIDETSPSINSYGVGSNEWSILRWSTENLPSSNTCVLKVSISITPNNIADDIFFASPIIYQKYEFLARNPSVVQAMSYIPRIFYEADSLISGPLDLPMTRFIDVLLSQIDAVASIAKLYTYYDGIEQGPNPSSALTSALVQIINAELETLGWLAKFSGTEPITYLSGFPTQESNPFILESSQLDSADTLRLTSYSELNPGVTDETQQIEFLQWQLTNRYYGINSGTLNAVIESTKRVLIGEKTVLTSFDYTLNPFEINIYTYWNETIGGSEELVGQPVYSVVNAVDKTRPLGVKINHELIDV